MSPSTPTLALPYPALTDTPDVPRDIQALANAIDPLGVVPAGAMLMWPVAAAPSGWLLCNGQVVPAATYPKLAALLGSTGGNVTLPNLTGRVPLGASGTHAIGSTGGVETVALSVAQIPAHSHAGSTGTVDVRGANEQGILTGNTPLATTQAATTTKPLGLSIASQGGGQGHENMPPFLAVNYIMRAG